MASIFNAQADARCYRWAKVDISLSWHRRCLSVGVWFAQHILLGILGPL
jgi:hypothetical protein